MTLILSTSLIGDWMLPWQQSALWRLLMTVALVGVIGLEREFHGRAAGFRTHVLVGLGCCLIMLVSIHFAYLFGDAAGAIRVDPARMAYGAVTGIGFLGAGVIIKTGTSVHGLTTAASLWCVSAVGLAMGLGMYTVATVATVLMLVSLTVMRWFGSLIPSHHYRLVRLTCGEDQDLQAIVAALRGLGATVLSTQLTHQAADKTLEVSMRLRFTGHVKSATLLDALRKLPGLQTTQVR